MSGKSAVKDEPRERTLSRIGRKAIPIPSGVDVQIQPGEVTVKGTRGTLTQRYHPDVRVKIEDVRWW